MEQKSKTDCHFEAFIIWSKSTAGKFFGLFQLVVDIEKVSLSVPEMKFSRPQTKKTKKEAKENDFILVENHTKCIGLRPTRPFSAYQTICASDLFP